MGAGMLESGIGAGLGLLGGVISGIIAKRAHDKYANALSGVNMEMPTGVGQAESVYNNLANQNLPGYNTMLQGIDAGTATTMTRAKELATSPAALMQALIESSVAGEQQKNQLGIQNADYRTRMSAALARFLGGTKAGYENQVNQFNVDKRISALKEKMIGDQQLMQGISGGLGSAFSNFGAGQEMSFEQKRTDALANYFNNAGTGGLNLSDITSMMTNAGLSVS